jgi:hypothetical protein
MATMGGIFTPDYDGAAVHNGITPDFSGVLAAGTPSGPIILGKYRLFKITFAASTTASSNCIVVRFTTGNSQQGHAAPTPLQTFSGGTAASPFLHNFHENFFETDGSIDSINLETFAADGAPASVVYSIIPLARSG